MPSAVTLYKKLSTPFNDTINLDLIFTSGQTFLWTKNEQNIWSGVIESSVLYLKQHDQQSILWYCPNNPNFDPKILHRFLHLDQNLNELEALWSCKSTLLKMKQNYGKGLRLLRQDFYETVFSFICSSNNNIKRISKMVQFLSSAYGKCIWTCPLTNIKFYSFPTATELFNQGDNLVAQLTQNKFGYRAKFIFGAAKLLADSWDASTVNLRQSLSYSDLLIRLKLLPGVGQKVADCIILMSCDKFNVIPIDVHMFKLSQRDFHLFPKEKSLSASLYREIVQFYQETFGEYAGWTQLILFSSEL